MALRVCNSVAEAMQRPGSVRVLVVDYRSPDKTAPSGEQLARLTNLERLILRGLALPTLPGETARLRKLAHLELFDCRLTRFPSFLAEMDRLVSLKLHSVPVKIPAGLALPGLRRLHLVRMGLSKVPKIALGARALYNLDLSHNDLHTLPGSVGALAGLRFLNLAGNPLAELPPGLGALSKLATLILEDTPLARSAAARRSVARVLPRTEIHW